MFSQKPSKRAGLSVFKPARENGFGIRVLVVAAVLSVFEARRLMQAGAAGVFLKQNPPNLLVDAIRSVMGGQPYIDPALRDYLRSDAEPRNSPETLPSRQYAMLSAVMEGLANKEWEIPLWNNVRCPLSKPDLVAESVTYVSNRNYVTRRYARAFRSRSQAQSTVRTSIALDASADQVRPTARR